MQLEQYFAGIQGTGVLATAGATGEITTAVYAKPHILDETSVGFVMRERLTYANLQTNGHANYLFIEQGAGAQGIRLFLQKIDETSDEQLIASMARRHLSPEQDRAKGPKHLVRFRVTKALQLVGDNPALI